MKPNFRSLVCLLLAVLLAAAVLTGCTQQKPADASTEAPQQSTEARPDGTPAATGAVYNTPSAESVIAAKLALDGASTAGESLYFNAAGVRCWASRNREVYATIGGQVFFI